jgi:hypothetical protein
MNENPTEETESTDLKPYVKLLVTAFLVGATFGVGQAAGSETAVVVKNKISAFRKSRSAKKLTVVK